MATMDRREWLRRLACAAAGAIMAPVAGASAGDGEERARALKGVELEEESGGSAASGERRREGKRRVSRVEARELVACTSCDRCMPCGYGVDIPGNFEFYNEKLRKGEVPDMGDGVDVTSESFRRRAIGYLREYDRRIADRHQSQRCIRCFHCVSECGEGIFIVNELASLTRLADSLRDWECKYL